MTGIDELDKAIIRELQADARMSYATLGSKVGCSQSTVRRRVERLVETDVMRIVAFTDPLRVGYSGEALIGLVVEGDARALARELSLWREVEYLILTMGSFDIVMQVLLKDVEHLEAFITERLRPLSGVRSIDSSLILRVEKVIYDFEPL
jgi:Lrp/AsnC family transcriptional regulator for asnA, asnC and gidA